MNNNNNRDTEALDDKNPKKTEVITETTPLTDAATTATATATATAEPRPTSKMADKTTRIDFIRRTLFYLFCALFSVLAFTTIAVYTTIGELMQENKLYFALSLGGIFFVVFMLFIAKPLCRYVPLNWIIFIIFITSVAYSTGFICKNLWGVNTGEILMFALGLMTISVGILWFYVKNTKNDITLKTGFFFGLAFGTSMFFLSWGLLDTNMLIGGLLGGGMGLFTYYIMWDLHKITIDGRYDLKIDDYLLGSTHLYLDFFLIPYLLFTIFHNWHKEQIHKLVNI